MTKSYAVMGRDVRQSLSPKIHQWFAEQTGCTLNYIALSVHESDFELCVLDFFKNGGHGLNITQPYKLRAYAMHDWASTRCHDAQAANTLWWANGKLCADNTDGIGLISDLARYCDISSQHILILGSGGAGQGVFSALAGINPQSITIANRTAKIISNNIQVITYAELQEHYTLVLNATSAHMPVQPSIFPVRIFKQSPICYDLNYHSPAQFMALAQQMGCMAVNGLGMLIEQAAESFYLWHGVRPQTQDLQLIL